MTKKKTESKIWWKNQTVDSIPIKGFKRFEDVAALDKAGISVQTDRIRSSETSKTVKIKLRGYVIDQHGDRPIPKAKKTVMINSKTTKEKWGKIIKSFHKDAQRKANKM